MIQHLTSCRRPFVLASLALLSACGGGGGGSGSGSTAVLIKDAPLEGLLAFDGTLEDVRLVDANGRTTANLLAERLPLEWTGLDERAVLVARTRLSGGPFVSGLLQFERGTLRAWDRDGLAVPMNVADERVTVDFPAPVASAAASVVLDLRLADSLTGLGDTVPAEFSGQAVGSRPAGDLRLRPLRGVVQQVGDGQLTVDLRASPEGRTPFSRWRILPSAGCKYLAEDATVLADLAALQARIQEGRTEVELQGTLRSRGALTVDRIQLLPDANSSKNRVVLEGVVLDVDQGVSFELLIQEFREGEARARKVLSGLGNPVVIDVSLSPAPLLTLDTVDPVQGTTLRTGQRVRAVFPDFQAPPPFVAQRVDLIHALPRFEGFIQDTTGLPGGMQIRLLPHDPAILTGQVQSPNTDVSVDLRQATIVLDAHGRPAFPAKKLQVGMRVEVRGTLSGTPTAPDLQARHVLVRRGHLEACVEAAWRNNRKLDLKVGRNILPFGGSQAGSWLTTSLPPGARVSGVVDSVDELFDLWDTAPANLHLQVELRGYGDAGLDQLVGSNLTVRTTLMKRNQPLTLWPPNHRYWSVDLPCYLDLQQGERVEVTAITQDEPLNGKGDGNTSPDGRGVGQAQAQVRAERMGGGNGRVYQVQYELTDADGDTTTGEVPVTVPKSQNGKGAKDDGQTVDSTGNT